MAKEESLELESTEEPKSKKKLFIFAGVGVLVALLIGGGVWFFMGSRSGYRIIRTYAASFLIQLTRA